MSRPTRPTRAAWSELGPSRAPELAGGSRGAPGPWCVCWGAEEEIRVCAKRASWRGLF